MTRRIVVLAAALMLASATLGAQVSAVTDAQLNGVDASIRAQVRAVVDSAAREGLPVEKILDLARRARMLNRSADVTLTAVRARLVEYRGARMLLGVRAGTEDVAAGAEALRSGADSATLTAIREQVTEEPLFVSLSVLADLVSVGVPADTAMRAVVRLVSAGVRNRDIAAYREAVQADIRVLNAPPAAAASARVEATIQQFGTRALEGLRNAPGATPTTTRRPPPLSSRRP